MEFPAREGTDNPGLEYEKEIAALLAIRYTFEESVQDFWIATNVDCLGDTDDVVLCITPENGENVVLLLQLKHENPVGDAKNFKDADFTYLMNDSRRDKRKERFSVDKYSRGYKKFQDNLKNFDEEQPVLIQYLRTVKNVAYIFYTNRELDEKLNCLVSANENVIFDLLNTSKSAFYGFNTEDFNLDEDFLQNLYLFPNQINFEEVFNLIKKEIRKLFGNHKFVHVDFDDVTKRFLEIIKLWTKGCEFEKKTKYITLSKRDVINILSDILLESYKLDIEENRFSYYDCSQKNIWNKLIPLKDIAIVYGNDLTLQFLKDYIGTEVKLNTKKQGKYWKTEVAKSVSNVFCEQVPDDHIQIMKLCGNSNNDCITMVSVYKLMWFYKNLPLLLEINDEKEFDDVGKILKISKYNLKVIVITTYPEFACKKIGKIKYFASLKDLEPQEKSEILNLFVHFQGRILLPLSELAKANMIQNLKCVDIIHILCNDFNVGNKFQFKCNYYINRSVSKILISFEGLIKIENEFFVIEAQNKEDCEKVVTEKLALLGFELNNCPQICILESNSIPKKLRMAHDCLHRLIFQENVLEWKESTGSVENITKYQIIYSNKSSPEMRYDDVSNFLNTVETNKFQIISECPGMGKSVLLNYITCFSTLSTWILPITLRDIAAIDEIEEEPSEFFRFYMDQLFSEDSSVQNLEFSLMVFKDMVKAKKVLLLLDGFDEISILHKEKFSNFMKYLQEEKFPVLITTRENMKPFLENKFNVLSKNLKSFTLDEQRLFLTNFFKLNVQVKNENGNAILLDFVEQLLTAAKLNLSDRDEEFTGIPLQLQLLANNFLKECKMSVNTRKVCLTTKFDLLDLYAKFVKNKTDILCAKYGASEKQWLKSLENHQHLFALQYLFQARYLKELNIKNSLEQYYEDEEYRSQLMQKEGILIAKPVNDKIDIDFIHQTFAEYLAAQWLTKNVKTSKFQGTVAKLVNLRFEEPEYYKFLFVIFDRILAKQCTLHLDIINLKVNDIKCELEEDPKMFVQTDEISRTAFHLFGLYANDYKEEDLNEILDTNLLKNLDLDILDNLNGYSALDYALMTRSWIFANKLCELSRYLGIKAYDIEYSAIEKLSLKYKFLYLTIFHNYLCRDLLVGDVQEDTQMLDYTRELSNNIYLSKQIYDFIENISTVREYLQFCGIKDFSKNYYHDLRFAIAFGTKKNIENLLSTKDIDINERDASNNHTLLHYATIYKRSDVVKMLLSKGADVNIPGRNGSTAVHGTARFGSNDILEMFVAKGANLDLEDNSSETPLDIAIRWKHSNVAKTLLQHNAKITNSFFVLHRMVEFGDIELLHEFLKRGFDVNEKMFNGRSPLHTALANNRVDMAKILIDHNCDFKSDNAADSLVHLMAKIGSVELLKLFLDAAVDIDKQNKIGETPLMIAIENGHFEFANVLMSNNVDVLAKCRYGDVLSIAISKDNEEIIAQLIEKGCDVNRRDRRENTPLLTALQEKKWNVAKFLLVQNNVDVKVQNNFGYTALHYCAMHGYKDLVIQCLGYGVDIDKKTEDANNTALLLALQYKHIEVAKLLILSKAKVQVVNKEKCNTLHYAAMYGDITVVQDLIAAGEELNLQDDSGFTPFLLALSNNKPDIALLLLSYDIDITLKTNKGSSTLHIAASAGNDEIITMCLEKKFDINEQGHFGRTPLLCALQSGKLESIKLLIKNGSDVTIRNIFLDHALHLAAKIGYDDLVLDFLNKGFDVNVKNSVGETPLSLALQNSNLTTAKLLHARGATIEIEKSDRSSVLHQAASCGYDELLVECLGKGYDINKPNFDGYVPLDIAIMSNKFDTVKLLIDSGAIPSILTFNLYLGSEVQSNIEAEDRIKYFKLLLDKFSNINMKDKDGNTIIHYVCNSNFIRSNLDEFSCSENFYREFVEFLLDLGADFENENKDHKSPYHLAVIKNQTIILSVYDKRKSDADHLKLIRRDT